MTTLMTGSHCNLIARQDTALVHPHDQITSTLAKGKILPVLAWRSENGILTFTLEDYTIADRNTWTVKAEHIRLDEALPEDEPIIKVPNRIVETPKKWTVGNIILSAPIIPGGFFTWSEATKDGARMPQSQQIVDNIIHMAQGAQEIRRRFGQPVIITSWYRPPLANKNVGGAVNSYHIPGLAIDFRVTGMNGRQIYKELDSWWEGGLGIYPNRPDICHADRRKGRARWNG